VHSAHHASANNGQGKFVHGFFVGVLRQRVPVYCFLEINSKMELHSDFMYYRGHEHESAFSA
jgi:hypothetical protein